MKYNFSWEKEKQELKKAWHDWPTRNMLIFWLISAVMAKTGYTLYDMVDNSVVSIIGRVIIVMSGVLLVLSYLWIKRRSGRKAVSK